jgi:hypothetical protein
MIIGLPKMRVLNDARVGQTHTKWSAVSSSNWQDAQTGLVASQSHPVEIFIKATMARDKRNQTSELFFIRQTQKVFGCLQLWVFNSKLRLSTTVKWDPVFIVCVNDPPSIHIPDNWSWQWNTWLRSTKVGVRAHPSQPISLLIALNVAVTWHPKQSHPVVIREILQW